MEDIIRRRHPNSIPALIYAASAVPGQNKVYESVEGPHDNGSNNKNNITAYLEKQVKTLEKELEERDEENSRKVRAIEQQYNAMSLRYEDHVKQLESKVTEVSGRSKPAKDLNKMEDELARQKEEYENIVSTLRDRLMEIGRAEDKDDRAGKDRLEAAKLSKSENSSRQNNTKKNNVMNTANNNNNNSRKEINRLKSKLLSKDAEVDELRSTVLLLQREREQWLLTIRSSATTAAMLNDSVTRRQSEHKRTNSLDRVVVSSPNQDSNGGDDDDNAKKDAMFLEEISRNAHHLERENSKLRQIIEVKRVLRNIMFFCFLICSFFNSLSWKHEIEFVC